MKDLAVAPRYAPTRPKSGAGKNYLLFTEHVRGFLVDEGVFCIYQADGEEGTERLVCRTCLERDADDLSIRPTLE
jgi:hypothetical protein